MKRIILNLVFVMGILSLGKAQLTKDIRFSLIGEYTLYEHPNDFTVAGGIDLQLFLSYNFALNYQCLVGYQEGRGIYFTTGWGQIASGYVLVLGAQLDAVEGFFFLAMLALIVPEGVSFHFDLGELLVLSPYINPLEAHYEHGSNKKFYWAAEAGVRIAYYFENGMSIQPHLGVRWLPALNKVGFNVGLSATLAGKSIH